MTAGSDRKTSKPHRDLPGEPFGGLGKTFGRRKGRPLRDHHQSLFDGLLPRLSIDLPRDGETVKRAALDPAALFEGDKSEIWLEIGYGGGEHLSAQARLNPDVGLIGGEFFSQGVAKLLAFVEEADLGNIRLFEGDARELLAALEPASLDRIFVLYPDPWPKKRHERRRFISPWTVTEFARVLKPGGFVRVATDIPVYCRWTLRHFMDNPAFAWRAETPEDWRLPPDDWVRTRYEEKALREGRTPVYLDFGRV